MIRFLQKDSRFTKAIFVVIIAFACIAMVITLVPGIFQSGADDAATYATVHGANPFSRIFGASTKVTTVEVQNAAQRMLQQQGWPQAALPFVEQRAGQELVQRAVLLNEADKLGLQVSDEVLRNFLHTGALGAALFPNGKYIGDARYAELVQDNFGISRGAFETEVKKELEEARLRDLVTGSVTATDAEVRAAYIAQATKIKFTYATFSSEDIAKTINPTDAQLQAFFKEHATVYSNAVPEQRKIEYVAFSSQNLPGGAPTITDAQEQAYYNAHQAEYKLDEQVKVRHILIKVAPNASPAEDAAAKAKAQGILDQLNHGGNFAELAKKNSDDPGSKDQGGELGFIKHGATVPAFDQAAFSLQPGQTSGLVKTQFGYHILQVEQKQAAHTRPFDEVKPEILATLTQQEEGQAENAFANALAKEAQKSGLAATAQAHKLQVTTTDFVPQTATTLPDVADPSKLLAAAFTTSKGAAPKPVNTGDGYAIFTVDAVQSAHAPDFATYKDHILADYRTQQTPTLLSQKTTQLADKAHAYNDLAKAAKELGATVQTSDLVGRDAQIPNLGSIAQIAPQLFTIKPGQISGPIQGDQSGAVAKLDDHQEPDPADVTAHIAQAKEQLLDQRREEAFAVFASNVVETYNKEKRISISKHAQQMPQLPS